MKVLTLTQPFASLVALGAKKIETRSWRTDYRGPLAIHAAKGLGSVGGMKGLVNQCARKHFLPALDVIMPEHLRGIGSPGSIADRLPLGAIVAVCSLVGCEGTNPDEWPGPGRYVYGNRGNPDFRFDLDWPVGEPERGFGDYSPGRYMWFLTNIRALPEPILCKGALGLWEYTGELPL